MLAQLFVFLAQFWRALMPCAIVDTGHVGVLKQWGVIKRKVRPGFRWKLPLRDTIETEDGREWTYILDPQSLTTADGVDVVLRLSALVRVVDADRYFSKCGDGRNNIQDAACGELGRAARNATAAQIRSGDVLAEVLAATRAHAKRWGMRVDSLEYHDCSRSPSMRLWQSSFTSVGQD